MKKIIFPVIMMMFTLCTFAEPKIDSCCINAEFIPGKNKINVNAGINFQNPNHSDTLLLLFNSNCIIYSVKHSSNELNYTKAGKDTLCILLNADIRELSQFTLDFNYDYPLETDSVILLDRGYRWYPLIAEDIFPFKMTVIVPEKFICVSAGNITTENISEGYRRTSFESQQPVFKIPLIIAPANYYSIKVKDCGKVKTYFYQINDSNAGKLDSVNIDICSLINYFSSTIGEYPHERFTIVQTDAFPGSNLGSSIVTSGNDNFEMYKQDNKEWLQMAVASQWICTAVFPRLFYRGFWFLSVSFPHYLRLMYDNDTRGKNYYNTEIDFLKETYKKIEGTKDDIPITDVDYPNTKEKGILIYAKGVLVLDKLNNLLGESTWIEMLRYFYREYNGKVITLDDFVSCINKYDTAGKCSEKFLKMLDRKGMPE